MDQHPLLSGQDSREIGLIHRIHKVNSDELDKYPLLKKTTATLPGTYTLKIDPTVPPVVHGPRRQPKGLADKITNKLNEMQSQGHITKVTEPTDWVSSMVTGQKWQRQNMHRSQRPQQSNPQRTLPYSYCGRNYSFIPKGQSILSIRRKVSISTNHRPRQKHELTT